MNMFYALLTQGTEANNVVSNMLQPIMDLAGAIVGPAIGLVVAIGAVYCIWLGVKLAKADEPQEHQKAKKALSNAIVGFILIVVLIAVLYIAKDPLITCVNQISGNTSAIPKA